MSDNVDDTIGVLKLFGVKAKHRWTDASFTDLLEAVHEMLPDDAKLLRWHSDERKKDGKLRHVADSPQWRRINNKYDEFGGEVRNIRFGFSSDGINPFGNMSSNHNTWPVLLCVYNIPPWLCTKRKYIRMSFLIEGPKQPDNDIDVYLAPLIDDLKTLWNKGVKVYDAYKKENFTLRAMIFCTISDFPVYNNLSGYSTKGKFVSLVCEDQTSSRWLRNCKKTVFMGHRRSLVRNHPYRKKKREFDRTIEYGMVPSSYFANIKKLVLVQDCKLVGMKSHDCRVFMTYMIPIAIRGLLPNNVRHTITKLCLFFNMIHSKVIDHEVFDSWQSDIIFTLCELEMYFLPSFFDVMVHLGARPEGSIVTGYLIEELIEFGNDVVKGVGNIGIPHSRHVGRLTGVGTIGLRMIDPDRDALKDNFTALNYFTNVVIFPLKCLALFNILGSSAIANAGSLSHSISIGLLFDGMTSPSPSINFLI
ncbi:TNP2-like transposon protein [Tanacetum coccineum]